jgi:preprotein translocase subunit YajC
MNTAPLLGLASSPQGQDNPFGSFVLMGIIFAIFYFVLILPMKNKQKKLDDLVKNLKPGDKVVITPGILGTVEGVADDALTVRIADKTKIRVLRGAVAGLQGQTDAETR